jgi:hypothetical protein
MANNNGGCGITRRGFLLGAAAGAAVAGPAAWYGGRHLPGLLGGLHREPFTGHPAEEPRALGMPGRYPGRVVDVRHPGSVTPDHKIVPGVVDRMIDQGMATLTGADVGDIRGAWGKFFEKGDVVGIKVNPVGRAPLPGEWGRVPGAVGSISSPAVVVKIVRCLRELGIPAKDVIVYERYADEFANTGYVDLVERELPGVRWYASSFMYTNEQLDVAGFDGLRNQCTPEMAKHIAGYDPDVFTYMGFCGDWHSQRDDRRFRTHLSAIVTKLVNKIITIPVLKDHRSAGVTLAMKNLSHGMNNNVARSHLSLSAGGFSTIPARQCGPNQCNTFIPQAAGQYPLRQKATLHILDGLIGVYEGGPGCWNRTWGTWQHKGLLFGTDPVAMDHVGWDLVDAQRVRMGWPVVEKMGLIQNTPEVQVATHLSALAASGGTQAATLMAAARYFDGGRASESLTLRQPDHIILAGTLGLGVFPRDQIEHRLVQMQGSA